MNITVRNALIGLAVFVVISGGLGALGGVSLGSLFPGLFFGGFVFYILSNIANNRAVGKVSPQERAAALATPPAPGHGLVYVYRDGFVGMALGIDVLVDNVLVGQLRSPRFLRLSLPAGPHTLVAGPKGFAGMQNRTAAHTIPVRDGETAVFSLKISMGALRNEVQADREPDVRTALARLATIQMVATEANVPGTAMPASPHLSTPPPVAGPIPGPPPRTS